MPQERQPATTQIEDFPGMASRADPDDVPPGASQEQVNVQSHRPGQLRTRGGVRQVTFEEE